ncbi:MAG: CBS domain-containing protein, partial [Sandaracinaceae bacterium]|nr:CBS domain-containing protein [Sandaracinaceae bacterium]
MQVRELMRREVVTVKESDTLALAMQMLLWSGFHHLPVMREGKVVGLLSERDVLKKVDVSKPLAIEGVVADVMSQPVQTVPPSISVEEAAAILAREHYGCLPVVETGDLVGIVTTTDVLGWIAQCPIEQSAEPTAGDIATRKVIAARKGELLLDAASRMAHAGVRHLPIIDGLNRVQGILSDRDVRNLTGRSLIDLAETERLDYLDRLKVEDAMTEEPRMLAEDTPLTEVLGAFLDDRFGALPVVDDEDHLLGILSYIDVLRFYRMQLKAP